MRIVVAPDKFKECLSAREVCDAIARGIRSASNGAVMDLIPVADGGEGTVSALVEATDGIKKSIPVTGPLGEPLVADLGLVENGAAAVIEMATVAGLSLVPRNKRDPRMTTTAGVGDAMKAAFDLGVGKIVVGIGGSATNDGGAGMAQRLGFRLLDSQGRDLPFGGAALASLDRIDMSGVDSRLHSTEITVACDVTNPLCGPDGASVVYGPQKGASEKSAEELDACLSRLAHVIQRDLGVSVQNLPGAGAAGGLGAGLVAFCGANLKRGFELVAEIVGLEERILRSSLVITGEGQFDATSRFGKTVHGVSQLAAKHGVPVLALVGAIAGRLEFPGVDTDVMVFPIVPGPMELSTAIREAASNLTDAAERVVRLFLSGVSRRPAP